MRRRECQSQATTGVYPCPNGEPSQCRYYNSASLTVTGQCVYYYCKKDSRASEDTCCKYYDGTVHASLGSTKMPDGTTTFDSYIETAGAATDCAAQVEDLATYAWHDEWFNDKSVDQDGKQIVTTAFINFQVVRVEFSHQYGLTLYSPSHDTVRIVKDETGCVGDACYHAYFKPISSTTLISIKDDQIFTVANSPATRRRHRSLQAVNPRKTYTVEEDIAVNHEARFHGSCARYTNLS